MSILDLHPELGEFETRWMRSGYAEFLRENDREDQAAELETSWGEWNAWEETCRNEVRKREETFGPDSPELATSLDHLADTCLYQDNHEEAEKHYRRALSIREAALGPDDCSIPPSLTGLARIHRFREEYALAEEMVHRAATISQACFGTDSLEYARTQEHLASLAGAQRQFERAEELYDLAVSTYRKVAGAESRAYAEGLFHFAHFYAAFSQFEKAERVLIELMRISEKEIDVAELEKADYIRLYANVLEMMGRTEEANEQSKRVEEIWSSERLEF
jgi:tetratricopeptide (TPR) repeat protein